METEETEKRSDIQFYISRCFDIVDNLQKLLSSHRTYAIRYTENGRIVISFLVRSIQLVKDGRGE